MKVNFDYEFKLFHQGVSPSWGLAMNQQLEYISLLWGDIKTIHPVAKYSDKYLEKLHKLNLELPFFDKSFKDEFFWGREIDYSLELKTNSKKTSFELALKKDWLLPGEYFSTGSFKVESGWVGKPVESVSGRGFAFVGSQEVINEWGTILSPWVDRVLDLSCVYRDGSKFFLINLNDNKGVFRGALVMNQEILQDYIQSNFQIDFEFVKDCSDQIIKEYQLLNAQSIQIDSFIYKENHQYRYYPLCEVNDRKTMGELAWRLKNRFFEQEDAILMNFSRNLNKDEIELSPDGSKFKLGLKALDRRDLESIFRTHQDLLKKR